MYLSSPTRDVEARQGLGSPAYAIGLGGVAIAAALLATVQLQSGNQPSGESLAYYATLFELSP